MEELTGTAKYIDSMIFEYGLFTKKSEEGENTKHRKFTIIARLCLIYCLYILILYSQFPAN